jgi:hypothetical protein
MTSGFDVNERRGKMRRMNLLPQLLRPAATEALPEPTKPSGRDAVNRLQVGIAGLGAMVLLVGVADMIMTRARQTEQAAVPEAAPTVEPSPAPSHNNNALEAAGVVPDLPKADTDEPVPEGPVLPEQGDAAKRVGE